MNSITEAHGAHRFLQAPLFFVDDRLDDHGASVHKRQDHEEREQLRNGHEERIEDVAGRRHLLHVHAGQMWPLRVLFDDGSIYHVLQVNETRCKVLHVDSRVTPRVGAVKSILNALGRIDLVTVHSKSIQHFFIIDFSDNQSIK